MQKKKSSMVGVGLLFGTVLGVLGALLGRIPFYWAGVGTVVGLALGITFDILKSKKKPH